VSSSEPLSPGALKATFTVVAFACWPDARAANAKAPANTDANFNFFPTNYPFLLVGSPDRIVMRHREDWKHRLVRKIAHSRLARANYDISFLAVGQGNKKYPVSPK
jgi:hypothetical protein